MSPATRTGSLRWRFTAWLFVALVGLAGPLAVYYQLRIDHLIAREADERLSALARHLASGALLGVLAKSEELLEGTLEGALSEQDVLGVAAFDASGGLIASRTRGDAAVPTWSAESTSCQPCAIDNHRLRWVAPVHRRRSAGGARTQEDFYSGPPPSSSRLVGWIVMEVSTERRRAAEREVGRRGLLISLTVLAVALVLTLFVARRLTSPLRSLAAATREIARGKWDAPLPTRSQGEIAQLALDFRDMTAALAELDRENRTYRELLEERVQLRTRELQEAYDRLKAMADEKDQFVATVSHDFRSPLAVILASIQTILADDAMPAGARRDFLDRAARQCKRLGSLVSDLLDLARIENRDAEIQEVADQRAEAFALSGELRGPRRAAGLRSPRAADRRRRRSRTGRAGRRESARQRGEVHPHGRQRHRLGRGAGRSRGDPGDRHGPRHPVHRSPPRLRTILPGRGWPRRRRIGPGPCNRRRRRAAPRRRRQGDQHARTGRDVRAVPSQNECKAR